MIYIFVEGEDDKQFLKYYLNHLNITEQHFDIIVNQGNNAIDKNKKFTQYIYDDKAVVLIVFDADKKYNNKSGYDATNQYLNDLTAPLDGNENDRFLFPNNVSCGCLENLLENIIPVSEISQTVNVQILACWENYENCISVIKNEQSLSVPALKSKIYSYLEVLSPDTNKGKKLAKGTQRDYSNTRHWDLDCNYLKPLKVFFEKYFTSI